MGSTAHTQRSGTPGRLHGTLHLRQAGDPPLPEAQLMADLSHLPGRLLESGRLPGRHARSGHKGSGALLHGYAMTSNLLPDCVLPGGAASTSRQALLSVVAALLYFLAAGHGPGLAAGRGLA